MVNSEFKFTRVDNFLDDMNREDCFDTADMDGVSPNFKFVLVSQCPLNIEECIDVDGTLRDDVVDIINTENEEDGLCSLMWTRGVNGERSISVSDATVSYDLGEDIVNICGIFLVAINNGTGYVMAYSIFDKSFERRGTLILPCSGVVWSVRYGN